MQSDFLIFISHVLGENMDRLSESKIMTSVKHRWRMGKKEEKKIRGHLFCNLKRNTAVDLFLLPFPSPL